MALQRTTRKDIKDCDTNGYTLNNIENYIHINIHNQIDNQNNKDKEQA